MKYHKVGKLKQHFRNSEDFRSSARQAFHVKRVAFFVATAFTSFAALSQDLPTAGQVISGNASISQSGQNQTITQTTDKAIINWGSFSIGSSSSVNFVQPGSNSVVLNRITGGDPSSILGSLSANGKVFLVNPNGIFFGFGSSVDTAGLVATTMSISDSDFLSNHYSFERNSAASIENAGVITIRGGGYALLAADKVTNSATGQINATKGNVGLVSADRVTIETQSDGLVGFSVEGSALRQIASVENAGLIGADGGKIVMSARGANELTGMVVNNTGVLRAQSIDEQDGAVILSASSGITKSTGSINTSGKRGGSIQVTNDQGVAAVSGQLAATGTTGAGGSIIVAGKQTGVFADSTLDVSGATGGQVRVGGDFHGATTAGQVSDNTYVAGSANLVANGLGGNGGSVVVWANDATRFDGFISAKGTGTGAGGNAEVSGKQNLVFNGFADLTALSQQYGTLLLDPSTITITAGAAASGSLDTEFGNAPANQILVATADNGGNTISRGTLQAAAANANVVLEATGLITLADLGGGALSMAQTSSGSLRLTSTTTGGVTFANKADTISTQGGNITIQAQGSGAIDIGNLTSNGGLISLSSVTGNIGTVNLNSGSGSISLSSTSGNINTANLDTTGTSAVNYNTTGTVSQTNGTRIKADGVAIANTSIVTLAQNNEVNKISGTNLKNSLSFKSINDLVVNSTALQSTAGNNASLNIESTHALTVSGAVNATANNASDFATVNLKSGGNMAVNSAISANGNGSSSVILQSSSAMTLANTVTSQANNSGANANVSLTSSGDMAINNAVLSRSLGSASVAAQANALTVSGAISALANNSAANATSPATITLTSSGNMTINNNILAQGGGSFGVEAAKVALTSTNGSITQSATNNNLIKAYDTAVQQADTSQLAHSASVLIQSDNGNVSTKQVLAESTGGRSQVNINAKGSVTATGTITSKGASQPGVNINTQFNSGNGNIDTSAAVVKAEQTAERIIPASGLNPVTYADINKLVENINNGVSLAGNTLNLGAMSMVSSAASGKALYGIATNSNGNTTFNQAVSTNSAVGITISTSNDTIIKTAGSGSLNADSLGIKGDRDKAVFSLATNIATLTALGGKAVDIDNSSHGSGVLVISALGQIADAYTEQNTGTQIAATNKPVGAVRIKSQNIKLLSMDNRSTNTYAFDGSSNVVAQNSGGSARQDLIFIANNLDFVQGTISTGAKTYVNLRPFTDTRNIQLAYNAPGVADVNTTYYVSNLAKSGLLDQFNPSSTILFGGSGYSGNISVGYATDTSAQQISLGDMTLYFETLGRFYNNYAINPDSPATWNDSSNLSAPYSPSPAFICGIASLPCLTKMTTTNSKIYIKDSLQQGNANSPTRNIVLNGVNTTSVGGTVPPNSSQTGSGTGGGNNNNSGGNNGGGSSGNGNDSGPGGTNAPEPNNGGGNETASPPSSGTTQASNNPGQVTGNPGGNNGTPSDPSTPGNQAGNPNDTLGTPADGLAGGGQFSGNDPGYNNPIQNGGQTSNPPSNNNNPAGGGTLTDGTTPGNNNPPSNQNGNNPVVDNSNNNNGFTGGGNNGNNNSNPVNNTGGGTLSDGTNPSNNNSGNTQTADNGNNGFNGGGTNSNNNNNHTGNNNTGGGTLSDGTLPGGNQPGNNSNGNTQVADNSNNNGFTGGANNNSNPSNSSGNVSGGATLSDGSNTSGGGNTQTANNGSGTGSTNNNSNSNGSATGNSNSSGSTTPGNTQTASNSNNNGFSGGGSSSSSNGSNNGNFGDSAGGATFSDGSGVTNTSGGTQFAGNSQTGGGTSNSGGSSNTAGTSSAGGTTNASGSSSSIGSGSTAGNTQTSNSNQNNSNGFSGGASSGSNLANNSFGDSAGGGTFSDGSGASGGSTQFANNNQSSGGSSSSGNISSGSGSSNSGTGAGAGSNGFNGGGSSTASNTANTGSNSANGAGGNTNGFSGGASGGNNNLANNSFGDSTGGASFSDGSSANGSGSTQFASNNTGSSNGQNGSSNSSSSSGANSNSGSANNSAGTVDQNTSADADNPFSGGAGGGSSSDAKLVAQNDTNQAESYPPCEDESQSVKTISKAGQPNGDMIQMKATGMRLRQNSGTVSEQRASCKASTQVQ